MAFAKGKHALRISDRSGVAFPYLEMRKEWNGFIVHNSEYEPKQPQLGPFRIGNDPIALRNPRPSRVAPAVSVILPLNPFRTTASDTTITVYSPDHGRSTNDIVRFRNSSTVFGILASEIELADGYIITKVDDNFYTFVSTTSPSITGEAGGGSISAGPVTITA